MQYSAGFFIVFEALSREHIQRVCDRGSNEEDDKKDKLNCIGYFVPGPYTPFGMRQKSIVVLICLLSTLCARAQDIVLNPAPVSDFRFKDIGGQPFSQNYISAFSYSTANVVFSFDTPGLLFLSGRVVATGLKPNFAYQIKLSGQPKSTAVTPEQLQAADDASNVMLGFVGRWWRAQPNPGNSDDTDFNTNKDTPGYVYDGYLIIGFFVTDASGNADVRFQGNNSYHVLWKTSQRSPGPNDGPPLDVTLPSTAGNAAYDVSLDPRPETLYGEWQPTRALPGTMQMTMGHYRCELMLTEESFHDTGALAGAWNTALTAPIEFDIPVQTVTNPAAPDPYDSASPLILKRFKVVLANGHSIDKAWLEGSFELPAASNLKLPGTEIEANLFGLSRDFTLNAMTRQSNADGLIVMRAGPRNSKKVKFALDIRHAAFVVPTGNVFQAELRLRVGTEYYKGSVSVRSRTVTVGEILSQVGH